MNVYGFTSKKELDIHDIEARRNRSLKNFKIGTDGQRSRSNPSIDIEDLSEKGLLVCPDFLVELKDDLKQMGERLDVLVNRKMGLSRVRNAQRENPDNVRNGNFSYVSSEQLEDPQFKIKNCAAVVSIANPFLVFPDLVDIVLHKKILDSAVNYFKAYPILSYVKITKSFANDLPDYDTQYWHFDFGAKNIFKVLVYLNDVNIRGGPFSYVLKSHSKRFRGWNLKSRFTDQEVKKKFGEGNMYCCEGAVGDVIFAETTGLHKGLKPQDNDRSVIIFNFTMHPEIGFPWNKIKIPSKVVSKLTPYQKLFLTKEVFDSV